MSSLFETIANKNVVSGNEMGNTVNVDVGQHSGSISVYNSPFPCLSFFFCCNFLSSTIFFPS
jgi:hypothetical protein